MSFRGIFRQHGSTALLLLNTPFSEDQLVLRGLLEANRYSTPRHKEDSPLLVAADGGSKILRQLEILPDAVVGDFDSVDENTLNWFRSRGVQVIREDDQDRSDLDKGLALVLNINPSTVGYYSCLCEWLHGIHLSPGSVYCNRCFRGSL